MTPSKSKAGKRKATLAEIRRAVADYMGAVGCGCCADREAMAAHSATLGRMLHMRKYADGSGYDFWRYRTGKSHE